MILKQPKEGGTKETNQQRARKQEKPKPDEFICSILLEACLSHMSDTT
jgi:hypothetical protein